MWQLAQSKCLSLLILWGCLAHHLPHFEMTSVLHTSILPVRSPLPLASPYANSRLSTPRPPAQFPDRLCLAACRQRPTKCALHFAWKHHVIDSIASSPKSLVTCHTSPCQNTGRPVVPHGQLTDDSSRESIFLASLLPGGVQCWWSHRLEHQLASTRSKTGDANPSPKNGFQCF